MSNKIIEDDEIKFIHDLISELQSEGFAVTGCTLCNNNSPAKTAKCRICGNICYPKDQQNN